MLSSNKEETAIPFNNHSGKCKIRLNKLITLMGEMKPKHVNRIKVYKNMFIFQNNLI